MYNEYFFRWKENKNFFDKETSIKNPYYREEDETTSMSFYTPEYVPKYGMTYEGRILYSVGNEFHRNCQYLHVVCKFDSEPPIKVVICDRLILSRDRNSYINIPCHFEFNNKKYNPLKKNTPFSWLIRDKSKH